jgi:hypothetical protein
LTKIQIFTRARRPLVAEEGGKGGESDDDLSDLSDMDSKDIGGNGVFKEEEEVQQKLLSNKEQSPAKIEEDKADEITSEKRPVVASRGGFGARCITTTKKNDAETKVFNKFIFIPLNPLE